MMGVGIDMGIYVLCALPTGQGQGTRDKDDVYWSGQQLQ